MANKSNLAVINIDLDHLPTTFNFFFIYIFSRVPTPFEIKTKYQNTEEYVRPWHGIILSYIFLKRRVAFVLGRQIGSTCSTQLKGDCILDLIYTQSSQTQPLFSTISPLCLPLLLCFAFCF